MLKFRMSKRAAAWRFDKPSSCERCSTSSLNSALYNSRRFSRTPAMPLARYAAIHLRSDETPTLYFLAVAVRPSWPEQ